MSSDITFVLSLDDQDFTVGLKNAEKLVKNFGNRVGGAGGASDQVDRLNLSIDNFAAKTRDLTVILATAQAAMQTLYSSTLGWQKVIMDAAGEIEKLQVMMRGMSEESGTAARELDALAASKFITDFAQNAPFKMDALTDTFVKLKTVGIDPTDGTMQSLTDSVANFGGSSEILKRASIAIQQMMGKGVISMEELRQQLGEAVPDAMQIMARSMNLTMAELVTKIESGTVESKTAIEKMMSEMALYYDGAGTRMMSTWQGVVQSMETRWKLFLSTVAGDTNDGSSYFNTVKGMADELSQWFVSSEAQVFAQQMSDAMATMAKAVRDATVFIYENRDAIQALFQVYMVWFTASRIAGGMASLMAGLNGITSSTSMLSVATANFTRHQTAATAAMAGFTSTSAAMRAAITGNTAAMTALATASSRMGLAFASLAGPIGMAVAVIGTAAYAIFSLRTDIDDLRDSILKTQGMMNNADDLKELRDERASLQKEIEAIEKRMSQDTPTFAGRGQLVTSRLQEIKDRERLLEVKKEIEETDKAIKVLSDGLYTRAVEGATASVNRQLEVAFTPINAEMKKFRLQMDEELKAAAGDNDAVDEVTRKTLEANTRFFEQKMETIREMRSELEAEREGIADDDSDDSRNRLAEIDASLAALVDREVRVRKIHEDFANAYSKANAYIVKPTDERDSKRALAAIEKMYDALRIKQANLGAKIADTNPELSKLNERIRQIRDDLQPEEVNAFDRIAASARSVALEIDRAKRLEKARNEAERAYTSLLNDTASSIENNARSRALAAEASTRALENEHKAYQELIEEMKAAGAPEAEIARLQEAVAENYEANIEKIRRDSLSSWDKMLEDMGDFSDEWVNVWEDAMSQATDSLASFVKEGKLNFADLASSIIEQILKISLQKAIVEPAAGLLDIGASMASAYFGGSTSYAVGGGFGSQIMTGPTTGSANGNVMTALGPAKLNMYSNGGIARSPQVSVFGEGARPEAYVPLPDGRSIPVTMQGGNSAPNVQFNLINQSGQQVEAEQTGSNFDGEKLVLDVVLKAMNRPGSFRDGMKGALK